MTTRFLQRTATLALRIDASAHRFFVGRELRRMRRATDRLAPQPNDRARLGRYFGVLV